MVLLIFLAGTTKRAQIPFSAWLPAAMAAPTPVSSLVHSSTLVTAGVYLIIRMNLIVNYYIYLLVISLITRFLSRVGALYEPDIKKVIALSTLSQLGIIIFRLSLGLKDLSFFHLISHALFKSLIFLCAGAYIHHYSNNQESRFIVNIPNLSSLFSVYFLYANISLIGLFFLTGFYSKDMILESIYTINSNLLILFLMVFRVLITILYTFRLILSIRGNIIKSSFLLYSKVEDWVMYAPMFTLYLMSLIGGRLLCWFYFPLAVNYSSFLIKITVGLIVLISLVVSTQFY